MALCTYLEAHAAVKAKREKREKRHFFDERETVSRSAKALLSSHHSVVPGSPLKTLFYSNVYGITFVSSSDTWEATRAAYSTAVESAQTHASDSQFERVKLEYFKKEVELMKAIDYMASMRVHDVEFHMDEATKRVTILDDCIPQIGKPDP